MLFSPYNIIVLSCKTIFDMHVHQSLFYTGGAIAGNSGLKYHAV